jgi:SPP1 gp7 family putative phage head morphogenesis protein
LPSDKEIEDQVKTIFTSWQDDVSLALIAQAEEIARLTAGTILDDMDKMERTKYTKAFVDGITDNIAKDYKKYIKSGGTICVEPKYVKVSPGKVRATTEARFVPWLNDFKDEQVKEIVTMFSDAQQKGVYPLDLVDDLEKYFAGTRHRAVTAARTEAQKIRTTARMDGYRKSNVKYVQYITAGDERVRPEHAMRDGKIYPLEKAPILGEYNCRCILTEADFAVEELGMPVTESEAEIIDISEVEI